MINKGRAMPISQTSQRENMATMYQIRRDDTINDNDKKKQLQDEFDKYMKAFKSYQSASPETKKAVEPLMEEALKNYYNLKINLYK